ncbi:MAG: hypothetical protein JNL72_08060 [Flavipsychrobacter sp.]|nr:hypothetical protein [Flavipsychrobacter sp.]
MITSSSIPYITQMLSEPHSISEADIDSIVSLTESYPYFVPARYMEAASRHKATPFGADMMNNMQLYMGNWLVFHEYMLRARDSEDMPISQPPIYEPADVDNDAAEQEEAVAPAEASSIWSQEEEDEDEPVNSGEEAGEIPVEALEDAGEEPGIEEEQVAEEEDIIDAGGDEEIYHELEEETLHTMDAGADAEIPAEESYLAEEIIEAEPEPIELRAENEDNLILPIYTEDYFLHQGIQVSNNIPTVEKTAAAEEAASGDPKSLMIVMSYTEWLTHFKTNGDKMREEVEDQKALKTMWQKEKLAAAMEEENEEIPENVFEMAVNSITREESIASESLAEIYVKQGKYDAAIDMYKKLSLRNPQKSAYFARKAEEVLKEK